jgi:Tol biopolymer transport system component
MLKFKIFPIFVSVSFLLTTLVSCNNYTVNLKGLDGYTAVDNPTWSKSNIIMFEYSAHNSNGDYLSDSAGWCFIDLNKSVSKNNFLLVKDGGVFNQFQWSNDSKSIITTKSSQLFKISFPDGAITQLTFDTQIKNFASFSPDDSLILYNDDDSEFINRGMWIFNPKNGSKRLLKNVNQTKPSSVEPIWSPHDNLIAFIGYRDLLGFTDLYTYDTTTSALRKILSSETSISHPRISRDGLNIVFQRNSSDSQLPQIWTINIDGNNLKQITTQGGEQPAWGPKGDQIVYVKVNSYTPFSSSLWIISKDGKSEYKLI